jgi:23S rRNA (uridine2552-2'-O)-methyltransferase
VVARREHAVAEAAVTAWRREQGKDRFFRKAHEEGYRARSAYKLLELVERHRLIRPGQAILDLGAAPGSWSQVAARLVGPAGRVVAVDVAEMAPLPGVTVLRCDITDVECQAAILGALDGPADVVLCDAAPSTTGIALADHARSIVLAEAALDVARRCLRSGGHFVVKVFRGSDFDAYLAEVRRAFASAKVTVPEATRKESKEAFVVGLGARPSVRPLVRG